MTDTVTPEGAIEINRRRSFSLKRLYLIARRDFLGYFKTWGFWIMAMTPFIGLAVGFFSIYLQTKAEPTRYATILDETGKYAQELTQKQADEDKADLTRAMAEVGIFLVPQKEREAFVQTLNTQGPEAARDILEAQDTFLSRFVPIPQSKLKIVPVPETSLADLTPYFEGERMVTIEGTPRRLSGALRIFEDETGKVQAEYYSPNISDNALPRLAERVFSRRDAARYLSAEGLNIEEFYRLRNSGFKVAMFDPTATEAGGDTDGKGKARSKLDRLPYVIAAAIAFVLWFSIFSGAYILMMSMVEEKTNKVMEMLLASTRFIEIFLGKMLGVAAVTLAFLLPWILVALISLYFVLTLGGDALVTVLKDSVSFKLLGFSMLFFILGYMFFGSIYMAVGSMAEGMQDVSTLATPMSIILVASMFPIMIGLNNPDSGVTAVAQWIPFSAPFASIVRLPTDPPLWQTLGSAAVLLFSTLIVIYFSEKIFRRGVLTGNGLTGLKGWFRRTVLRKSA